MEPVETDQPSSLGARFPRKDKGGPVSRWSKLLLTISGVDAWHVVCFRNMRDDPATPTHLCFFFVFVCFAIALSRGVDSSESTFICFCFVFLDGVSYSL